MVSGKAIDPMGWPAYLELLGLRLEGAVLLLELLRVVLLEEGLVLREGVIAVLVGALEQLAKFGVFLAEAHRARFEGRAEVRLGLPKVHLQRRRVADENIGLTSSIISRECRSMRATWLEFSSEMSAMIDRSFSTMESLSAGLLITARGSQMPRRTFAGRVFRARLLCRRARSRRGRSTPRPPAPPT